MYVCLVPYADFVVWSPIDCVVTRVLRDAVYSSDMVVRLASLWETAVLPELLCRSLEVEVSANEPYNLINDLSFQVGTYDGTSMTKINNMMHQETPYKTIQGTKYSVQVVVCKLAAMSEKNSVCIFCNEGSTSSRRLTNKTNTYSIWRPSWIPPTRGKHSNGILGEF